MKIQRLQPCIQEYAWGDSSWLQAFTGHEESIGKDPWAELWLGTHPKGMSEVLIEEGPQVPLAAYIANDPAGVLGCGRSLPLLFKILAVSKPLSIQCHPTKEQAEEGFARESAQHIPLTADERNYKDDNHKPEILCAVTPFTAMCGFRSPQEIRELFVEHLPRFYDRFLRGILEGQEIAESAVYAALLKLVIQSERGNRQEMLVLLEQELSGIQGDSLELKLVRRFFSQYPGDLSVLAPLYLNVLTLQPGEALYQPAGELHAYVEGIGVELMASSDNVLRGGLTPKHIDAQELQRIIRFEHSDKQKTLAVRDDLGRWVYPSPSREFQLSRIDSGRYEVHDRTRIELMIQLEGASVITCDDEDHDQPIEFFAAQGVTFMIPASVEGYTIVCDGTIYAASIPEDSAGC
ncbi:MAG: mannose-6-phosphate isomerase, class I [Spirochaetia bacterium]|nr:mannose-6-phosphate isomerase, class I [Spirochaetia bacterium]